MSPVIRAPYPTVVSGGGTYLIDYISGSTAYLYPYADRTDSPRVAGKYQTVAASSIAGRVVFSTPIGATTTAEMPQVTDGNAYGYIDLSLTRTATTGTIFLYRNVDANNRWELRFPNSSTGECVVRQRVGGAFTTIISVANAILSGTTYQVGIRVDGSGHVLFRDGSEIGRTATIGPFPTEATATGGGTGGTVHSAVLYPHTITL